VIPFEEKFTKIDTFLESNIRPNFNNILKVLKRNT